MAPEANPSTVRDFERLPVMLRSYQTEMFERSLEGNTIVVMETGSGKTLVAIYRIMHALETIKDSKLIWFLTESVALCRQQYESVRQAIPHAVATSIVGSDGPDLWGSQSTWSEVLKGVDIVFSTFAVLHSALEHAYVPISKLALLIFDEAHHVTKDHPSNRIMREFYHRRQLRDGSFSLPSIMGLTASPAENGKLRKLQQLEANLAAVCRTPRKHRLELRQYVHRPSLERLEYVQNAELQLPIITMNIFNMALTDKNAKFQESIVKVKGKVAHLVEELGLWAASTFVADLVSILQGKVKQEALGYAVASKYDKTKMLELLLPLLDHLRTMNATHSTNQNSPIHVSAKAQCFIKHLNRLVERQQENLVAIVFVRQRVVTAMMDKLLACHPDFVGRIKSGAFVGESNSVSYERQLCELVVPRTQSNTLQDFRRGKKNLIVATDALDEGIDVAACNTIICFDPPQNLRSFIQKRGRARKKESTYTIMVPLGCSRVSAKDFEDMEELMSQMIQRDDYQARIAHEQEMVEENVDYRLQSNLTEAYMTAKSTRAHLEHFCAKLPRTPYTELRPEFTCTEGDNGLIVAEVRLPMFVPPDVRTATSARAWLTERAAIKDAAFQAYRGLYKFGLLTEHLLPVDVTPNFNDDFKEQRLRFHHLGERLCVWDQAPGAMDKGQLFRTSLVVQNTATGWRSKSIALWTHNDMSPVGNFELFAEDGQILTVKFHSSVSILVDVEDVPILSSCTRTMTMATRSKNLSNSDTKFAVFITPDLALNELQSWLGRQSGDIPAHEFHLMRKADKPRLIVNAAQPNLLHIFRAWHPAEDEPDNCVLEVECSPFPRRRNFLKVKLSRSEPIQDDSGDDTINTTLFDAENCFVRIQAVEYIWVMRLIPSVFHNIEVVLLAQRLKQHLLARVTFENLPGLISAITSPASGLQDNYDRLEFLGDSLLKFHVSRQLYCQNPEWHEEYLTKKRSCIVSNINLAKAAVAQGIDKFIIHEPFNGKNWTVPSIESISKQRAAERHIRMKVVADVVESLIGAAFLGGGMSSAQICMSTLVPEIQEEEEPFDNTARADSCSDDPASGPSKWIKHAESVIGRSFRKKYLLLEALTHPSCTRDTATEPYQRLEFLGDAVLDHLVVTHLFRMLPSGSQSLMTKIKSALVNGDFLAFLCYSYGDTWEGITYTASATDPIQRHTVEQRQGLWMMMRCEAEAVADARKCGSERFESLRQRISDIFLSGESYPWEELCMLRAPKFISDIVESILGAIFVDSDGNLETCCAFLEKIGLMGHLRRIVTQRTNVTHPREKLQRLLCGQKTKEVWGRCPIDTDSLSLSLQIDDTTIAQVSECCSKEEARIRAANAACKYFESNFGHL